MSKDTNKKNREYWIKRAIIQDEKLERDLKKIDKQIKKLFVEANKEIKKELAYFYANQSNITEYEKYRLESTLKAINTSLDNLYQREEEKLNRVLVERYMDIYKENIEELSVNIMFEAINESVVAQIVKTNWSGTTFSERIWEHRRRLAFTIKQELSQGLLRGDSLQDMAKRLADKMNVAYSDSLRLVHTETCWVQNQATIDSYKEADVVEYEFFAFVDKRTSKVCRDLDGKIFKIKEGIVGVNIPPL